MIQRDILNIATPTTLIRNRRMFEHWASDAAVSFSQAGKPYGLSPARSRQIIEKEWKARGGRFLWPRFAPKRQNFIEGLKHSAAQVADARAGRCPTCRGTGLTYGRGRQLVACVTCEGSGLPDSDHTATLEGWLLRDIATYTELFGDRPDGIIPAPTYARRAASRS